MTPDAVQSVMTEVRDQQAHRMLRGSLQIAERGVAAGGKNAAESVRDFAQIRRALAPVGQAGADDQQDRERK